MIARLAVVRSWTRLTVALRVTVALSGAVALLAAPGGRLVPGLVAVVGGAGLLVSVVRPGSAGPAVVLGAAALAWTARYGLHQPPVGGTVLLAAALVLHHQSAALAAALPPTAGVQADVLLRFGLHAVTVLVLSGAVAILTLAVGRPGGSVPLELAGLLAVVLVTAVPVLLARRG